jgi:hypothetical protein
MKDEEWRLTWDLRMNPQLSYEWLSEPESYNTTDGHSASLSLNKSPILGLRPDFYLSDSCGFVDVGRSLWREDGSVVTIATGPRQRSYSMVQIPLDPWPYFTVSDSRLPFSSPPTTRKSRWKYSTLPPHGFDPTSLSLILRPMVSQPVYLADLNFLTQELRANWIETIT